MFLQKYKVVKPLFNNNKHINFRLTYMFGLLGLMFITSLVFRVTYINRPLGLMFILSLVPIPEMVPVFGTSTGTDGTESRIS